MTVIELGEPGRAADHVAPSRPPLGRSIRPVALALVAVLCLLGVTGSDRPEPSGVRTLWNVPLTGDDGTLVTSDLVLVQHSAASGSRLTAYELKTGRVRWRRQLPGAIGYVRAVEPAGLLLAPTDRQVARLGPGSTASAPAEFHRETVALDIRTGADRWRTAGEPQLADRDTALMAEFTEQGNTTRVRVVRLSDNTTVWSLRTAGIQNETVGMAGGRPTRVVTAGPGGAVRIYRYADGKYLGGGRIPWVDPRPDDGYFNDLYVVGDRLLVNQVRPERYETRAYRLNDVAPVWSLGGRDGYVSPCGSMLCTSGEDGIQSYDAASGTPLWRLPVTANVWDAAHDRLVVESGSTDDQPALIDARTGRMIGEKVRGRTVGTGEPAGSLLVLRPTGSPPERTVVTRWDLRTGRQQVLGTVGLMGDYTCEAAPGYLTCRRGDLFEVTAVR
jgi:outer membrane protein assembly factor BamB